MNARHMQALICFGSLGLSSLAMGAETNPPVAATNSRRAEIIGTALRSTDLERSIKFYTTGLGLALARTLELGSVTEVIFSFGKGPQPPFILMYKNNDPDKSPAIDPGDGFSRIMLRVPDVSALAQRLSAAGYTVGEVRTNPVNNMKLFSVNDPDGYRIEITEFAPPR